jgi:phage gpG-like protein
MDPIQITLSPEAAALLDQAMPQRVLTAMAGALQKQNLLTIGQASERRMNFPGDGPTTPEGLRHRTGHLLRSLRSVTTVSGDTVTSSIGSNVRYFGVHEFGFQGTQQVKAYSRRAAQRVELSGGQIVNLLAATRLGLIGRGGKIRKGMGKLLDRGSVNVRAHERRANFPARMMIQKTIAERLPEISQAVSDAAEKALVMT